MATRSFSRLGCAAGLSSLLVATCSPAAVAQAPPTGPEGNWQVDWIGSTYEHTPDSVRISLYQNRTNPCDGLEMNGCVFADTVAPTGEWAIEIFDGDTPTGVQNFSVDDASGSIGIRHYYHIFDYWGGTEQARLVGPNAIDGDWTGNNEAGKTRWSRIVPTFTALEVRNVEGWTHVSDFKSNSPNRIEVTMPWVDYHWNDDQNFPHQRPQLILNVDGRNLWGRHFAGVPGSKGIEVRRITSLASADGDGALEIEIKLWPGVHPGVHTLYLDGQALEIDLKIPGFPEDPNDISIGPLRFTGLSKLYHPKTDDLIFQGLQSTRHIETENLEFTGLQSARHLDVGGIRFEGYGASDRIVLRKKLVFEGWRADLTPISSTPIYFIGWAAPETAETDALTFEGWRWNSTEVSTEKLKFTGHGEN